MNKPQPLLEARDLGRRHRDGWLLQGIHMRINPGERLAIVGPSGSGKTLLLRSLALLDPLDAGEVLWQARPIIAAEVPHFRRQAIYLHQRAALFEGTVEDNLRLPFTLRVSQQDAFARDRVHAMFTELGRDESFLDKDQKHLSGGESQLVALVRALQLSPALLFLDEPTSALDPATTLAVERQVFAWQRAGDGARAFVWVSHDAEQIQRVADRQVALHNGRLV